MINNPQTPPNINIPKQRLNNEPKTIQKTYIHRMDISSPNNIDSIPPQPGPLRHNSNKNIHLQQSSPGNNRIPPAPFNPGPLLHTVNTFCNSRAPAIHPSRSLPLKHDRNNHIINYSLLLRKILRPGRCL